MLGVAPQTKPRVGVGPGKWELIGAITVPLPGHGTCANGHSVSLGSEPALGSQHALLEWRRPGHEDEVATVDLPSAMGCLQPDPHTPSGLEA